MKNNKFFLLLALHFAFSCLNAAAHPAESICPLRDTALSQIPTAEQLLQDILSVTGLQSNFELKQANVRNIEASISHSKRFILYNPDYILHINNLTRNKWAVLVLLSHEVGHHLNGHTINKKGSTPHLELEADEFAGFVLYQLGASLNQAQEVMYHIASINTSDSHPARSARLLSIETGWNRASAAKNNH